MQLHPDPDAHTDTAQRIYDAVALHLIRQGAQAYDERADQVRFALGKLRSPVGHLLGEHYSEALEGQDPRTSSMVRRALGKAGYPIDGMAARNVLCALEWLHHYCEPRTWILELYHLAGQYGVSCKVLLREGFTEVTHV